MARSLTPTDISAFLNLMTKEITGQNGTIQSLDASSFVSAGEKVMSYGVENVYNAYSIVMGRTFAAVRPYKAPLNILNSINTDMFTNRMRKISFYSRDAQESGDFNTDKNTNFKTGYTNGQNSGASTPSMWEQNLPVPLEMNFAGQDTWEDGTTIPEYQLKAAFRDMNEFRAVTEGVMTERGNDIESQKEGYNRMTLLNHIAGSIDLYASRPGSVVNLTADYNDEMGTSYTTAQLLTMDDFFRYFVYRFKLASDYLKIRSALYHWSPAKTIDGVSYTLLRHTPRDRQRAILYDPMFIRAKTMVYPELFNPQFLDINNFEPVTYWQNLNDPSAIDFTPAIPDVSGNTQIKGDRVQVGHVVGVLYDVDAMMTDYQLEEAAATPLEARKHYRNLWWTFSKNAINDFTEKSIVFIMQDD